MTNTMRSDTMHAETRTSDLVSDKQTMPPFRALDGLSAEITRLDEWVSAFIGRIQPYCSDSYPAEAIAELRKADEDRDTRSALVRRIEDETAKVSEIIANLDRVNQRLEL